MNLSTRAEQMLGASQKSPTAALSRLVYYPTSTSIFSFREHSTAPARMQDARATCVCLCVYASLHYIYTRSEETE